MNALTRARLSLIVSLLTLNTVLLIPEPTSPAPSHGFGWVPDPAAADALAAELPIHGFDETPAFQAPGSNDVYLWDACRRVTGDLLPPRDQGNIGACVGFGTAAAVEHLSCVQADADDSESYRELAPEIIYAGSRVEVGGGKIRGDGSVGAWAAKFVNTFGVLPRGKYPNLDLTKFDVKLCRKLGNTGVPDALEPQTKEHPVKSITRVKTFAECQAAIRNGYPMIVCSDQGFSMTRDADGFCHPQGNWMHCMAIVGIRGGSRPGAFLLNSWGPDAHRGPLGPGNPSPAGFWADAKVIDRMLAQGDSWAFSQFTGFPARELESSKRPQAVTKR